MADPAATATAALVLGTFHSDGEILAALRSPPTHDTREVLLNALLEVGRFDQVQRVVERGNWLEGAAFHERLDRAAAVAVTNRSLPSLKILMEEGLDVAQVLCEHEMAGEGVVGGLLHLLF